MTPIFSYCIPTWNSLPYLKILLAGIKRHASVRHEIIVHDNGSTDGTKEWLEENHVQYTRSESNLGYCGVNAALKEAKAPYVMLFNTDMWPFPDWDTQIYSRIAKFKAARIDKFTISSCLVEPAGCNPEYTIRNFGTDYKTFDQEALLRDYQIHRSAYFDKPNTIQYSHPILLPKSMLEEFGFMDERYFPGWASDHDLAASAYHVGCRDFVMLGWSRVYHFISKTFSELPSEVRNRDGQDIFQQKWNMSVDDFRKKIGIRQVIR